MVMVSNQTGIEVGHLATKYPGAIGHLYSPGGQRGPYPFVPYALDNGAFKNWDEGEWRRLLRWALLSGQKPLWAAVPDVVGDRDQTLWRWGRYSGVVRDHGFRPAFVAQDGMTFEDVPDDQCMVFIGGRPDTTWKQDAIVPWSARFPGRVHVGRVNTWERLVTCWRAGAVSIDGTGWFHHDQKADLLKFLREVHA